MKDSNLVIVESHAKTKIIKKYLNSLNKGHFEVIASFGHIRDLDKKNGNGIGIDINNGFKPIYITINDEKSKKALENLGKSIKNSNTIWLAADLDREGEAIAWHIKEHFKLKKYKRIVFNEITKDALKNAIENPTTIDMNLVDAQQSRRFLDRIVGFQITPLLWNRFNTNIVLSAGRVQSATLNIIIDKENEILKHKSESYYTLSGNFKLDKYNIEDAKYTVNDKIEKINNETNLLNFMKRLTNKYEIEDIKKSDKTQKAPLPFITSTLQQVASGELKKSIKQIMKLSQDLYEAGLITYMRTDSYNLSDIFVSKTEKYIISKYGKEYYGGKRIIKKSKNSQEAHEAIRPTNVDKTVNDIKSTSKITNDHKRLYNLIWNRTVASLMNPARFYEISICIKNSIFNKNQCFMGKFKIYYFEGYMILYNEKVNKNIDINRYMEDLNRSKSKLKMINIEGKNTWTVPPPHYSEATIVKVLEKGGIGRPSTYSSILSKLYEKKYIEKKDLVGIEKKYKNYTLLPNNKILKNEIIKHLIDEKSKLVPTDIGQEVNKFIKDNFKDIINIEFTSNVEKNLDEIAKGKKTLNQVMNTFYKDFSKSIKDAKNKLPKNTKGNINTSKKIKLETYSNNFKINNVEYIVRIAKYGPVIQFKNNEKNSYISLVPYLKNTGKSIEDINKKDINLLISLPKVIGKYKNKDVKLLYARYGFYLENNGKNATVFKQYVNNVINEDYDNIIKLIKNEKIKF